MNKQQILTAIAAIIISAAACGGQQPTTGNETNGDAQVSLEDDRNPQQEPVAATPADILTLYKKVLNSETAHFDAAKERNVLLKEYLREYNANAGDIRFTIVDMDGDGIPEVALEHDPGIVRVLHYERGTVYGFSFDFRAMSGIKKDGSFEWSNGAFNSGVGRQKFDGTFTDFFHIAEAVEEPDGYNGNCYIYYNSVAEQQFQDFMTAYWQKEDPEWKPFTTQNVNSLKAWDALQYFYVNIPDPGFPIPMRQGAVIPYSAVALPEAGFAVTGYSYDDGDSFKEAYKQQLRKAGFVKAEDAPDWIESLWRYNRHTDGATLIVELYEDHAFVIQMSLNYF